MPTTVAGILITVLVAVPGLLGEAIFQAVLGRDWREKEWRSILRLVAFSVVGVTFYSLLASDLGWPPADHLVPRTYERIQAGVVPIVSLFPSYAGHAVGGAVSGGIAALAVLLSGRLSPRSPFPAAWDDFVRTYAANRWVVVGLSNEEVFAGRIANADLSVPAGERDLILAEPCSYDPDTGEYRALNYQVMFLPAPSIYSIAGVFDAGRDKRIVAVGDPLFEKENTNAKEEYPEASTT